MSGAMFGLKRWLAVAVVFVIAASGVKGLTAGNTTGASKAGSGTGLISGYVISNVHYGLNSSNPLSVDSVSFTATPTPDAAGTVRVQLAGNWYSCSVSGSSVTCTTTSPAVTLSSVTSLTVVAAQ